MRPEPVQAPAALLAEAEFGAPRLMFVDGFLDAPDALPAMPEGVSIRALASLLEAGGSLAEAALPAGFDDRAMPALNGAFLTDGVIIEVAAGTTLEQPLHLLFLASGAARMAQYPRVMLRAGANSAVTIIEHYLGRGDAASLTNTVTIIDAGPGARVEHCKVQDEGDGAIHVGSLFATQARDSEVTSHSISLGAALARHDIDIRLDEPGAGVVLNGLYLAGGSQHVDHHTRVDHAAPHTRSEEDYRGVIDDAGHAVFNGRVLVRRDSQKIDAAQSNRNLLLSSKAEIDTKPELEIYADDVKCSHGATVGQLDEQALFYLRSRGIQEQTARALLTFAFADDVINRVPVEALRARLEQRVLGRMPESETLEAFV